MRVDERIGPYRVLEEIGVGGMGEVSLALDGAGRAVAVKVLHPTVARDAVARRRLEREVAALRLVRGPNVAEVLDADLGARRPYLVTRYAQGRTLAEVVRERGPLRGEDLDRLVRGLARALAAIHGAGLVHRDLKPTNVIMVDGEPVVIDFGLAHHLDATRLTLTGTAIGTPGYLAPEVLDGLRATPAADVFSWGATVAFAATGRPPFGAGPSQAVFSRMERGRADLSGVPRELLPLVKAALSPVPARRPAAGALPGNEDLAGSAVDAATEHVPAPPPEEPPEPKRRAARVRRAARRAALAALPALCALLPLPAAVACAGYFLAAYARDAWRRMRARLSRAGRFGARVAAVSAVPLELLVRLVVLAAAAGAGYSVLLAALLVAAPGGDGALPFGLLTAGALVLRGRYGTSGPPLRRVVVPLLAAALLAAVVALRVPPVWWPVSGP
ncbi:hypothetical protein GCM10009678_10620 [Actinomadura kijaniata]|uniref:serine/threonine-protein kinase n=1 Tax=Actinomadura kijaniata TaxID=46161 RepID=UPI002FEA3062